MPNESVIRTIMDSGLNPSVFKTIAEDFKELSDYYGNRPQDVTNTSLVTILNHLVEAFENVEQRLNDLERQANEECGADHA